MQQLRILQVQLIVFKKVYGIKGLRQHGYHVAVFLDKRDR